MPGDSWVGRLRAGLGKMREGLVERVRDVFAGAPRLDEALFEELEAALLGADTGVSATQELLDALRAAVRQERISDPEIARARLEGMVAGRLRAVHAPPLRAAEPPTVVLVVGVNGTGKTTSVAKLAHHYRQAKERVLVAAGDTFRAAAIEQLAVWADRLGVPLVRHGPGADPAAVAYDACEAARARGIDWVFVDTAGRLHTKHNLMEELKKVRRVVGRAVPGAPHEVLLVMDATTGLNGVRQAQAFHGAVGVTGIVLTKCDGTARGGVILAIGAELGLPVKWVGVGEAADDLQPFDPEAFSRALFG